jgi:pimeloyl-ACP methyl ester carboxylesterase
MSPAAARFMLEASASARRLGDAVRAAAAADLHGVVAAIEMPLGVLWGERDRVVGAAAIDRIRAARPDVPVEVIPAAGHVPQLERPRAFRAALARVEKRMEAVTD